MEIKKQLTDPSEDSETYQNRIRMTKTPHAQPSRFQKAARAKCHMKVINNALTP